MAMDLLPEVDSVFWLKGRLASYSQWPFKAEDGICTQERMAAAGFHFVGNSDEPDVVECFICAKQLDGWDATDDPWKEHVKHQKDCPFVNLNKQDEKLWTINDLYNMMKIYYVNDCIRKTEKMIKDLKMKSQLMAREIPKIYKNERKSRKVGK